MLVVSPGFIAYGVDFYGFPSLHLEHSFIVAATPDDWFAHL